MCIFNIRQNDLQFLQYDVCSAIGFAMLHLSSCCHEFRSI